MIISKNGLDLVRHEEHDAQVQDILQDPAILESLSEARSLPSPMPSDICFRIQKEGKTIGQVCLKRIRWINRKAELSLFIKKDEQGKGSGLTALKAIIEYGFKRLNLYRLESEVIANNTVSVKLMEKTGFTLEGRLREAKFVNGEYFDLLRYGLLLKEFEMLAAKKQ